jgi:hypothetical protein
MASAGEAQAQSRQPRAVRWWPAAIAFLVVGVIYTVISAQLTVGPSWALLALAVLGVAGAWLMRWRGSMQARRVIALATIGLFSAAVSASAFFLVNELVNNHTSALPLLRDGGLVWMCNIVTFSLWYWELDGGGPAVRHALGRGSTDFLFPQSVAPDDLGRGWLPEYVDYLFVAFNTSTAFSPTDTPVLARRTKMLTMWQSIVSLITVVVIAARAINTI